MERDKSRRLSCSGAASTTQRMARARAGVGKRRSSLAEIWYLKRRMREALKGGFVSESTRAKLRLAGELRPDLFGEWRNL